MLPLLQRSPWDFGDGFEVASHFTPVPCHDLRRTDGVHAIENVTYSHKQAFFREHYAPIKAHIDALVRRYATCVGQWGDEVSSAEHNRITRLQLYFKVATGAFDNPLSWWSTSHGGAAGVCLSHFPWSVCSVYYQYLIWILIACCTPPPPRDVISHSTYRRAARVETPAHDCHRN